MAGNARYTALLDACVLFPVATADALLSLATAGLFAAKWTQRIELEWIDSLETLRPDLKGRLTVRRDSMRKAVPDWEVLESAWTPLVGNHTLPDPDDRHVLAAAIAGHADCIVTANLRDFPVDAVACMVSRSSTLTGSSFTSGISPRWKRWRPSSVCERGERNRRRQPKISRRFWSGTDFRQRRNAYGTRLN